MCRAVSFFIRYLPGAYYYYYHYYYYTAMRDGGLGRAWVCSGRWLGWVCIPVSQMMLLCDWAVAAVGGDGACMSCRFARMRVVYEILRVMVRSSRCLELLLCLTINLR